MKKIVISSLALASVVLLSSCEMSGQSEKKMDAMEKDSVMMKQSSDDAMMKKEDSTQDAMEKEDTTADAMMKADVRVESGAMMQK